ncbi:MAG: hypothetical protein HYR70_11420, partial [Chloroflexi bacterium]|nr:hypothetical protein [Chloroflexota bacterium]MBI3339242.1 hypothetical protein [Chloroflexota bacterium]
MKAIGKTPVYWIVRIVLSLAIVFILSACAAPAPLPAEEETPTPTLAPTATPTAENTPTPKPTPVPVGEIFQASPSFYTELSLQDKEASKHFSVEDGKTYLSLGSQKVEVDPLSGGVNIDVNGKPLLVEGTGYTNPLTIRGVGENEGKVFAFAPQ